MSAKVKLPEASSLRTLIGSQNVPYLYYSVNPGFDKTQPIQAVASELFRLVLDPEGQIVVVSYRIQIDPPDDLVDRERPDQLPNLPMELDMFFQFWPNIPIPEANQAELKAVVQEAALRARIQAADLVYHMGGADARTHFVDILHKYQKTVDSEAVKVDTLSNVPPDL